MVVGDFDPKPNYSSSRPPLDEHAVDAADDLCDADAADAEHDADGAASDCAEDDAPPPVLAPVDAIPWLPRLPWRRQRREGRG